MFFPEALTQSDATFVAVYQGGSLSEAQPTAPHNSPGGPPSWEQGGSSSPPMGLEAAIVAAKASAEPTKADAAKANGNHVASKHGEEVIDLLSGDEGEKPITVDNNAGVVGDVGGIGTGSGVPIYPKLVVLDDDDKSANNPFPPTQSVEGQKPPNVASHVNGLANNAVRTTDGSVMAAGDAVGGDAPPGFPASIRGNIDATGGDTPRGIPASDNVGGNDNGAGGDVPQGIPASNSVGGNDNAAGGDAPRETSAPNGLRGNDDAAGGDAPLGVPASNSLGGEDDDSSSS